MQMFLRNAVKVELMIALLVTTFIKHIAVLTRFFILHYSVLLGIATVILPSPDTL